MKLKIRESSNLTLPLVIADEFELDVRHLSQRQQQDLADRTKGMRYDEATGQMTVGVDEAKWLRHAPDTYIAGWRGLTPSVIRQLGIDLEDDLPTDADGTVAYDMELARDLWRYAQADRFAVPIMRFSRNMLAAADATKKKPGATSAVS